MSAAPAVIYGAKSTPDPHGSIVTQLADCRAAAERDGRTVVGEYHDEAASAFHGNRGSGLTAAKDAAIAAGAELWVQHSDRLARGDGITADHLAEIWFALRRHGVRIRSVQDDHNLEDALRVVLIGERNNEDSKRKADAVKSGLRRRAERGKLVGGTRPYGYRWVSELVDGRKVSHLEPVPEEVPIVREDIYLATVNGMSQLAITRALNERGAPTVRGGPWTQSAVRRVLTNPIYMGRIRHNGDTFPGAHDAIISEELWDAAAAVREAAVRTKGHGGGRRPSGPHLLTRGLLRCCWCGSALVPRSDPNRRGGNYHVYRCDGRRQYGPGHCPLEPLDQGIVDAALLGELTRSYIDLDATRRQVEARLATDRALAADALALAEREAAAAAERLRRVRRAFQDGVIEAADWADQRPGLIAERDAAEAEVQRLREQGEGLARAVPEIDAEAELLRHLADLRAAVVDGIGKAPNLDATRTLLRRLFEQVVYVAPTHPWLVMPGFTDDMPEAGGGYLLLDLNASIIEGINADDSLRFERAVLPVEQPLREGLHT